MGFFKNMVVKGARKNFTLMVIREASLRLEAKYGRNFNSSLYASSFDAVARSVFDAELADHVSVHPSIYKQMLADTHRRVVEKLVAAVEDVGTGSTSLVEAEEVQRKLTERFAEHGMDYMSLHPDIHRALLKEALAFGRVERTVEMFLETVALVQEKARTDEQRAEMLLEVWKARGELMGG